MADTEGSYNGENPNGWGWSDTNEDHFLYRRNGDIVAEITRSNTDNIWYGWFFGASSFGHSDLAQVFRFILVKLVEYGY